MAILVDFSYRGPERESVGAFTYKKDETEPAVELFDLVHNLPTPKIPRHITQ